MHFRRVFGYVALALCLWPAHTKCSAAEREDSIVVLVSLDGFRHDYASLYGARRIQQLASAGATAEGLVPVFPSMTFSSHYSIVTGMYPDRHGIVDNVFYDPILKKPYNFAVQGKEAEWYSGIPLWALAEKHGIKAAVMGWPGGEAPAGGIRSSFSVTYAELARMSHKDQIEKVLEWVRLPAGQRPRLIAMYFPDADSVAHKSGPAGEEIRTSVQTLDATLGQLWDRVRETGVPVDLIIVSDHGMIENGRTVMLREYTDLTKVRVVQGGGAIVHIYSPDPAAIDKIYEDLHRASAGFRVYRRNQTPASWHYSLNPRIGDLVVVATEPVILNGRAADLPGDRPFPGNKGGHGHDPHLFAEMNGIFVATGPHIRAGAQLKSFENIHVYPLIAQIFGLPIPSGIDGRLAELQGILQASRP